ncbi:MAG: TonB-dependent receptor [bacterium]|nr:TonB-dependent receptor [bacterium]
MKPRHKLIFCIICLVLSGRCYSQVQVSGTLYDREKNPLPEGNVRLLSTSKVFMSGTVTNQQGQFSVSVPKDSSFILLFSYVGHLSVYESIRTFSTSLQLGDIVMKEDPKYLKEVEVKVTQNRGAQKGDTTQFNADAFKTHPDATAEDLIKKMPGVTSDNSGVKVNGEAVQKVLVDGKPFFGDDPNAALKNIPAEIIDKVEVFDKMSDQAQFTGFSDGDPTKTLNFVTKKGKNQGQFGKVYAGIGADENSNIRYQSGVTINSFKGKQRLSLLFLGNNINQQNFSASDITGALGSAGGGGGGRGGGSSPLMNPTQNGITTTQAVGLNYSDDWGKKINVSGSYFFNNSSTENVSKITRTYFTENKLIYNQVNDAGMTNKNHRFNFRFDYTIDSANKLTIVPSLSFQDNRSTSSLVGTNSVLDNILVSGTTTDSKVNTTGYDFSNSILYLHKFNKNGRTISLNVTTQLSEKQNNGNYISKTIYSDSLASGLDQVYTTYGYTKKISPNLAYTEPLSKYAQLQISYNPSLTEGKSDKQTNDFNTVSSQYSDFNATLSNKYVNTYETQKGGLSYRYQKDKMNFSMGADVQQANLNGEQTFPFAQTIHQPFQNILPNARFNYRFSKTNNLRIFYRSSTNIPSMVQLQAVMDVSNPLQLKTGNAVLKQTFENNLFLRYGGFDPKTSKNTMFFFNVGLIDNYIGTAIYLLKNDTLIQGYQAKAGSQLTKPVNLNGYQSARAFFVYGFPVKALKSNLNVNGGVGYIQAPSLINDVVNYSNSYAPNAGLFIGSNISQKLDFSLGYNANYTSVKNSVQKQSDNSYFTQSATLKVNWIFLEGIVINTDFSSTLYTGLSKSYNQQYYLWNASIGYKFLKNKALEAKVSVFDLLNQNRSISRTVTGSYTEDNQTTVLRRYFMFTLTYTLRNFKNGQPPKVEEEPGHFPGGPPPGMRPQGGGGSY